MSQKQVFLAVIEDAGSGGAYVKVPFDVEKVFGKKRVKVKATIDGEPYRGSIVRMGSPYHMLGVLKEIREKIGKSFGDEVEIVVEKDVEPREVVMPLDLLEALKGAPEAEASFARLSCTHQKEYVRWIEEAKREQTRKTRIDKAIEMLKKGK
jgi:bifunctional DNA-binding transcriptional regulator/antitoxin component of YhaV-PrlF toxin-antitoxin module